jgi:hypothetical protein
MLIETNQLLVIVTLIIGVFNPRTAFAILAAFFIFHHWPLVY